MLKNEKTNARKLWPADCKWPEPYYDDEGFFWDAEEAEGMDLDDEGDELFKIGAYYDYLVSCGRLNDDYTWNEEYDGDEFDGNSLDGEGFESAKDFVPEMGEDYWFDNGFDYEMWEEDLSEHVNRLKIDPAGIGTVSAIESIIGYDFVNENLLRQAFTRRAFAIEHGLSGDCEQLEFLGDSVLGSIVTREIIDELTALDVYRTDAPFSTKYSEGDLTKIRSSFVCKENLVAKAAELGLDQFILYGSGETPNESSREDMMEALIGAVAIDCGWDMDIVSDVVDTMLCIQLSDPGRYLKKTYYEMFNAWHAKHFGELPDYTVDGCGPYSCVIRFSIPENDMKIWTRQIEQGRGETRSKAREMAAELAYHFVVSNGLWINLRDSGITPDLENSINQLQELYQKKYLEELPEYTFEETLTGQWHCDCKCCDVLGWGMGNDKTQAKKEAAFMVLEKLFRSVGNQES